MNTNPRYCLIAACMMRVESFFRTNVFQRYGSKQRDMLRDVARNAGRPLSAFIGTYVPPGENGTSMYLEAVSAMAGIGPQELI